MCRVMKAKVYIFNKYFDGLPKEGDFVMKEEDLPPLKDGEFLAEAVYLSLDPYMRAYSESVPLGSVFVGYQIARVLESKNPNYPIGRYVSGHFGWRTHTVTDGKPTSNDYPEVSLIPEDIGKIPLSYFLGVTGLVGMTAYFGFLEICQPKKGDTVVVSGAAGAVGSIVGQIAKIKECTVIGIAGSEEKGKWLLNELGFDHFINYKTDNVDQALSQVAPDGVDCYFDNVSGHVSDIILQHMNDFGRISQCGAIALYNEKTRTAPMSTFSFLSKQLKMEGFLVFRWKHRFTEGTKQQIKWLKEGKIKYRETITHGFENMLPGFVEMLQGKNVGKALIKM